MHVKIMITIGPSCLDYNILKEMVKNGVRIFRLNFSHNTPEGFTPVISMVRKIEEELKIPITLMGDLSGPKIRIGEVENSPLTVSKGSKLYLGLPDRRDFYTDLPYIPLVLKEIIKDLEEGVKVVLSDGVPVFRVIETVKKGELYVIEAENSGIIASHKGINFPGKKLSISAVTEKDRKNIHDGLKVGVDGFALSFVQDRRDIEEAKKEIDKENTWVPVIAKIETASAVENFEEILEVADGAMVARGDLGLEYPLPKLPIIQKKILQSCIKAHKPSIVATQMLLSMVNNSLPTRAETTDVANAIIDGADCLMLSDETAIGKYPLEAVKILREIAETTEKYMSEKIGEPLKPYDTKDPGPYLAYSACLMANHARCCAIACHSTSGKTASQMSSCRPFKPIYGLTPDKRVIKAMNFYWGVVPVLSDDSIPNHLDRVEKFVEESSLFRKGDRIIITSGQPTPGQKEKHTNQIKIYYK